MIPTEPAVSVVVPTRGRVPRLQRLLTALAVQVGEVTHEVVVVVDGPDTASEHWLASQSDQSVRYLVRPQQGGPGAARNVGWRRARGRVVAFIDDDCVPAPDWLQVLTAPVLAGDVAFAQGRTDPMGRPLPRDRWARTITIREPSDRYETCNIAYDRSILQALGGFDEGLPQAGEDADLGLRARAHGAAFTFVDDAVVYHERVSLTFGEMLASRGRAADLAGLIRRHPAFREHLVIGVFWNRRHAELWAAAAMTLAGTTLWRPTALLALPALVAHRTRRFPDARTPRRVLLACGTVAADVWELGHTLSGAIRARTLLL